MDATSFATFYAFVALVIFLAAMVYLGIPGKIGGALDTRSKRIEDELAEAVRLREEAQALLSEYARKASEAEREAANIIAEAKTDALRLTEETTKSLEELIARRTKAAESKIAQAESQAVAAVRARAADVAIAAAEQVLKARIVGEAASDLMSRSIAEVGAKLN
jgi:F-type H+-transporting ATPase subunit b